MSEERYILLLGICSGAMVIGLGGLITGTYALLGLAILTAGSLGAMFIGRMK